MLHAVLQVEEFAKVRVTSTSKYPGSWQLSSSTINPKLLRPLLQLECLLSYICIYVHIHIYKYTYIHTYIHICTHTHMHTCMCVYVCMYILS
jgi:hypothetical protein